MQVQMASSKSRVDRYRLSATDDNLRDSARVVRDPEAVGHNAQRRLHAIQTLFQLSYNPAVCAQSEL
jgi:hypothetical protein